MIINLCIAPSTWKPIRKRATTQIITNSIFWRCFQRHRKGSYSHGGKPIVVISIFRYGCWGIGSQGRLRTLNWQNATKKNCTKVNIFLYIILHRFCFPQSYFIYWPTNLNMLKMLRETNQKQKSTIYVWFWHNDVMFAFPKSNYQPFMEFSNRGIVRSINVSSSSLNLYNKSG